MNLERPVTLLSRLGGHLVQGHVDGVGEVLDLEETPPGMALTLRAPLEVGRYIVPKGSIAVDGVSLTVANVHEERVGLALVPHTLAATTLGEARPRDLVNLEVDVLAKYIERLMRRDP